MEKRIEKNGDGDGKNEKWYERNKGANEKWNGENKGANDGRKERENWEKKKRKEFKKMLRRIAELK